MDLNLNLGSDLDLALAPAASDLYSPSRAAEYNPYFPSYAAGLDIVDQESGEYQIIGEPHAPSSAQDVSPQVPYDPTSPPYVPLPGSPPGFATSANPVAVIDLVGDDDDGPPLRRETVHRQELRLRRLIEANRRWRHRGFLSSPPYHNVERVEPPSVDPTVLLLRDIMSSHSSLGTTARRSKAGVEGVGVESSEEKEGQEERNKKAANFECNVCLDMAKEPVVTSCGHLFCWPCLYQWLHVHSEHKECPVCKGEVADANITPIYGRGSSEDCAEKKVGEEVESVLKIPPRPRGNRLESLRQQLIPLSRRIGEGIASLRQRIDGRVRFRGRNERHTDTGMSGVFAPMRRGGMTRLRPRRTQREEVNVTSESDAAAEMQLPENDGGSTNNSDTSSPFRDGLDVWHRFSIYNLTADGVAAFTTDLSRAVGRFISSSDTQYGSSASSSNPPNPELQPGWRPVSETMAGDQASASSTMARIEGDVGFTSGSTDPNSAGSSRSLRRRVRSSNLASLDVDGGGLHGRKRRRLN